jgi:hypothetical protein
VPRIVVGAAVVLALASATTGEASAWVYPEHRDIGVLAVEGLDRGQREELDRLWAAARLGGEPQLCTAAVTAETGCIDWVAWPAIAGDHSCSAAQMARTAVESGWILRVAAVGAKLKQRLAEPRAAWRGNVLRSADVQLQRTDPHYVTRAAYNDAHFLLARPGPEVTAERYLALAVRAGAQLNALGIYALYHLAALEKAARWSAPGGDGATRARLAQAVLADEAFALHFLQDGFAAGHVAGNWGRAAVRKGTHDYYNGAGVAAVTWDGALVVLQGDASMRPEDARRAARASRASLAQVLDAAAGRGPMARELRAVVAAPETLDVCQTRELPARPVAPQVPALWMEILRELPAPALGPGAGALPRFRAELGPFIGVSAAAQAGWIDGGFAADQTSSGAFGGLEVGIRLGLGLEGVMDDAGDGLAFIDVGLRADTPSSMTFVDNPALAAAGAIAAAIPARAGLALRVRLPFCLLPGDLLLGALLVAPLSPSTYAKMAITASNGGLIPWQLGVGTPVGRFQAVLGREVGIVFYGYTNGGDRMLMPPADPASTALRLVALRTISFDFPLIEYRPFRSFSLDQASVLVVQVFAGMDVPGRATLISPAGAPLPDLRTVYDVGLRVGFDWRRY